MTTIREAGDDDVATIRDLLGEYAASLPFDLAFQGFDAELAMLPHPYVAPAGIFLLVCDGMRVVGLGGFRPLSPEIAEIKRMYLVPTVRGRGLGRRLLEALIEHAAHAGYRRLRLDTDRATMVPAIALYRALGFVEIAPYGPDRDGALVFFERDLPNDDRRRCRSPTRPRGPA